MKLKVFAGALAAYTYNEWLANFPSRHVRQLYLGRWMKHLPASCNIQMGCRFLNGRKIKVGQRSVLNFGTMLDGRVYPIEIGEDVSIGPEAAILTLGHDPQSTSFADQGGPVKVGDRVWIGYRAIVLPGIRIGEGAVVAAGSVVTRDVDPYTIVAGSPARPIGTRPTDLQYCLDFHPWLV